MPEVTFNCPRCKGHLTVDSRGAGKSVLCPLCKEPILVPGESPLAPQQVPGQAPIVDRMGEKIIIYSPLAAHSFTEGHTILGRYRVVCELGQGGMGDVYRCLDETGCIDVALKALPAELSRNTTAMKEVRDNFRLIEKLHHPNIAAVKTLECDTETGDFYLIMEYVEGINLYFYRKKQGSRLTKDQALPILRQIAAALDYAHSEKILHRDIKPSNLMIRPDGTVKLLDFGLATQIQASVPHAHEESYDSSGTVTYMAPEQWRGQYQGPATDQYALACTAYELLAGHVPFTNNNLTVLREAVLNKEPPSIDGLDSQTWEALKRGLSKDWEKRFASCSEFVQAFSGNTIEPMPVHENDFSEPKKAPEGQRKRKIFRLLAFGIVVIIVLVAGAFLYREHQLQDTARRTAEKQQYLDKLAGEVRALLEVNNISAAREKITKAEALELGGPTLTQLKTLLARTTNRQEALQRFAEASVAREKAQKVRRDVFGLFLDRMEVIWRVAEAARASGAYGEALSSYNRVLEQSRELLEMDARRNQALTASNTVAGNPSRPSTNDVTVGKQLYPDLKSPWGNSLGMKFVPVRGTEVLFCVWETRVQDYEQFVKATGREWPKPDFAQGLDHPAVRANWDDANKFCAWLTQKERASGLLGPNQAYRLPRDWEWSMAVGLNEPKEGSPKGKDANIQDIYPWGREWPPPRGAGNFADATAKQAFSDLAVIEGYDDGHAVSAPVGSFKPNQAGLYDLSGNVWEWCEDFYDGQSGFRVLRGGAWSDGRSAVLLSSYRGSNPPEVRYSSCGFRVVLGQFTPHKIAAESTLTDGIPEAWKKKYGFDILDPTVARADPDNDAFSNLEEYRAGTNPLDAKSHPEVASKLRVWSTEQRAFKLRYMSCMRPISGTNMTFGLNLRSGRTLFMKLSEVAEGYKVVAHEPKAAEGDVLILEKGPKQLRLVKGKDLQQFDSTADLILMLDRKRYNNVTEGNTVKIRDMLFNVIEITTNAVTLRDLQSGNDVVASRIADGERAEVLGETVVTSTQRGVVPQLYSDLKAPWANSLGMKFVAVMGTEVLFCIWETRVQDYEQFVKVMGDVWSKPDFEYGPDHPVGNVSWDEAQKFCTWLTKKERDSGLIGPTQGYRLPKDWEWSVAVGLRETKEGAPIDRGEKIADVYPWNQGHGTWPPPRGAGNYSSTLNTDDFRHTSPTGSFASNAYGLFDLGGNVWELCEDEFLPGRGNRVVRGGSCYAKEPKDLLSSRRGYVRPGERFSSTGFRVVLGQFTLPMQTQSPVVSNERPFANIKAVFASTETKNEPALNAKDGNFQTKWSSLPKDNQWFIADLGENRKVTGVVIYWDAAHPLDYKVQVSSDRANWTEALKARDIKNGRNVHTFKPIEGRYIRIYSLIRDATQANIALYEIQVLVDGNAPPPALVPPAVRSEQPIVVPRPLVIRPEAPTERPPVVIPVVPPRRPRGRG